MSTSRLFTNWLAFGAMTLLAACSSHKLEPVACVGVSAQGASRDLIFQGLTSAANDLGYVRAKLASDTAIAFNGADPKRHLLAQELQPYEYVILVYASENSDAAAVANDPDKVASRVAQLVESEKWKFSIHECPAPQKH